MFHQLRIVYPVLSKSNSVTARNLFLAVYFWQTESQRVSFRTNVHPCTIVLRISPLSELLLLFFHSLRRLFAAFRVSSVTLLSASRALSISSSRSLSTLVHRDALFRSFNYALRRYAVGGRNEFQEWMPCQSISSHEEKSTRFYTDSDDGLIMIGQKSFVPVLSLRLFVHTQLFV